MNAVVRQAVVNRSNGRCEYCGLGQDDTFYSYHIEHIVAKQHHGSDDLDNLALSCRRCNLYKGTNLTAIDPDSGRITPLFNPLQNIWDEHFAVSGPTIVGLTPVGRATVRLLKMNTDPRRDLRWEIELDN